MTGSGNKVQNNYIGTDSTGTKRVGNNGGGVEVSGDGNTIGGTAATANVLSGNGSAGIGVSGNNNFVQNNFIGTDPSGMKPLGNDGDGLFVSGANNTIGGGSATANVISGNGQDGIRIEGDSATDNQIAGNILGMSGDDTDELGNGGNGIAIIDASDNTIGGTTDDQANVIADAGDSADASLSTSGAVLPPSTQNGPVVFGPNFSPLASAGTPEPTGNGIFIEGSSTNNPVTHDYIGITPTNQADGNKDDGVLIQGSSGNTIGGTTPSLAQLHLRERRRRHPHPRCLRLGGRQIRRHPLK